MKAFNILYITVACYFIGNLFSRNSWLNIESFCGNLNVIYVNAAVDDGSEIAKMMQYFKKADADDMTQGDLSKRVHYLKREKGGYKTMCEVAERIYKQGEKEAHRKDALRLQEKGKDATFIADVLGESVEQIKIWLGLTLA